MANGPDLSGSYLSENRSFCAGKNYFLAPEKQTSKNFQTVEYNRPEILIDFPRGAAPQAATTIVQVNFNNCAYKLATTVGR